VLGALFLDGGFDAARGFVLREFSSAVSELTGIPIMENPKGELQELLQAHSTEAPQYQVSSVAGPDHDRIYECAVHHGGVELARGRGKSKKTAESDAALAALQFLRGKVTPPGQITMKL
jgi:ribonuclease III